MRRKGVDLKGHWEERDRPDTKSTDVLKENGSLSVWPQTFPLHRFGSSWGFLSSLFGLTHRWPGRKGRIAHSSAGEGPTWLEVELVRLPVRMINRHYGICSSEYRFSDKRNRSLYTVTERQTPFFISPCISHCWQSLNNISTPYIREENVQWRVPMRDEMSLNITSDKVETLLLYSSPSPLLFFLVLPVASYF